MGRRCDHADIRYCPDHDGAVACFACGRLFGRLASDDTDAVFTPYNVPPGALMPVAAAAEQKLSPATGQEHEPEEAR